MTVLLPPPDTYGLPPKFDRWRDLQAKAILAAADSDKRFVSQCAPTGFGKSLVYMGQAAVTGARTIILTSTKGLQDQLSRDFGPMGLVDIRGANAYPCKEAPKYLRVVAGKESGCDEGPCHSGVPCALKTGGCYYYDAIRQAQAADLVVTNYAFWFHDLLRGEKGLGEFDLMVVDEAHDAPDTLADFLAIELEPYEVEGLMRSRMLPQDCSINEWAEWAGHHDEKMDARLQQAQLDIKTRAEGGTPMTPGLLAEVRALRKLVPKVKALKAMRTDGSWVWELQRGPRGGVKARFDAIWPGPYAERVLFRGVPKVVLFSATMRPKTAKMLAIPDQDHQFIEYPSSFPKQRRPVIHVPTTQMNRHTDDSKKQLWLSRIDQIISKRTDRKGIIHTVSYERAKWILERSKYSGMMMMNSSSHGTRQTVEEFKSAATPRVLVSPSMTTGWDFPYTECEYQIIGKVPFPDARGAVMKARSKADPDYHNYLAMQTLVQMAGRGMRAEDDQCETLVIDDSILWFMGKFGEKFAPKWFREAIIWGKVIPGPLPKL